MADDLHIGAIPRPSSCPRTPLAVKLVTMAVGAIAKDIDKGAGLGRAEALRRAMVAARPAHWTPAWHPSVWAPLLVVTEGAAG